MGGQRLVVTGVEEVERFDEEEVVMRTAAGVLVVGGASLHIGKLNLDGGELHVDGNIDTLAYEDAASAPSGGCCAACSAEDGERHYRPAGHVPPLHSAGKHAGSGLRPVPLRPGLILPGPPDGGGLPRRLLGGLLDGVYCLVALASVFFFIMAGDGELRLFILAGILGGGVLFFCLLSPLLLPLWRFWLGILLVPLRLAGKIIKKFVQICKKLFSFLKSWFTIMFTSIGGARRRPPEGGDGGDGKDDGRQAASQQ